MRHLVLATSLSLLLTACGGAGEAEQNAAAGGNETADLTPEGPSFAARLLGGGKPVPLDAQVAHPSGLVLQLTSLQAKPTETVLGVQVVNGDDDEKKINAWPNNKNSYILASTGEKLYLSPPVTNPELAVAAGQRMEGELVFLGRLPKSGSALLILNDGDNLSSDYTNSPGFRMELPLQSAAFSDDGSKKN